MGNDELTSVRERLENLKKNPKEVPKPLDLIPEKERKPLGDGMFTFERIFHQKVEKAIRKIEGIKEKMTSSQGFMNLFYDLKDAEQQFLGLLKEAEEKHIDFPDSLLKRIEEIKDKIRSKIR